MYDGTKFVLERERDYISRWNGFLISVFRTIEVPVGHQPTLIPSSLAVNVRAYNLPRSSAMDLEHPNFLLKASLYRYMPSCIYIVDIAWSSLAYSARLHRPDVH